MMPFETPNIHPSKANKSKPIRNKAFDLDDLVIDDDNS